MSPSGTVPISVSVLERYVDAGVFGPSEFHLAAMLVSVAERDARRVGREAPPVDDLVVLGVAVAARAPRSGHVCVDLDDVHRIVVDRRTDQSSDLTWPDTKRWAAALEGSELVADPSTAHLAPLRPLVWDGRRLYLHRLWQAEVRVAEALVERSSAAERPPVALSANEDALALVFGTDSEADPQHLAGRRALDGRLAVIVGGPGTGKTHTLARVLAAAHLSEPSTRAALCAPTGKAAARMTDAVQAAIAELGGAQPVSSSTGLDGSTLERLGSLEASTLHRLLGRTRQGTVEHDRNSPLPHDVVVVDETSMVDLPLMAQLLDALRPDARLVLVGDPDQLASVEAGTVLADLVAPVPAGEASVLAKRVVRLDRVHRFGEGSGIAAFADAVRRGDADTALSTLGQEREDLRWVRPDDERSLAGLRHRAVDAAVSMVKSCRSGDVAAALALAKQTKVLAAVRMGACGLHEWSDLIESGVAELVRSLRSEGRWALGRPLMVTRNDPVARVANGDTGVVSELAGRRVLSVDTGAPTPTPVPVARLDSVESWWAMTIHKSQGSEFSTAIVSLPVHDSPVLTRELLYTGATRARDELVILASEESLRTAIARPAARASGLADRLLR
ncbi:MAG: exodeoxyribonuclease V subunit alpha [Microthrixaceae bacterium]